MKNRIILNGSLSLFLLMFMTCADSIAQPLDEKKPSIIPIKDAIGSNILDLQIIGASDPRIFDEVVDRDGIHFGKCMAIVLRSNIDSVVLLKIDCGTELIPFDSTFQTMIVTKSVELPLYPGRTYATRFYAMCGELHDDPPYVGSEYEIGELSDSTTVKLALYFEKNYIQSMIGQHALWAYTDKADFKELVKYGADSLSVALTADILNSLAIETSLNPKKPHPNIFPKDSFEVNKYLIYGAVVLIALLVLITIYLIFRKSSNK